MPHLVQEPEQARETRALPAAPSRRAGGQRRRGQVPAVGVHVLAEERHLAHAVAGHLANLLHQLLEWTADLTAARGRHDAVRAHAVAADADLQPALERALAPGRETAGEALELEISLGGEGVAGQELREAMHLPGPERHVHEREALEDLILDRLRPASPHPMTRPGCSRLSRLASPRCERKRLSAASRIEHVLKRIRSACALSEASR